MSKTIIDLCSDSLCMNEATHTMISPFPGYRTKMCDDHHSQVLAAAAKAGLSQDEISKLDIQPIAPQGTGRDAV
jgi:hypothetical protein